ncbi:hypothetical protein Syun_010076 [Stephania yunnanensis]|uniref:Uncharacterized protein n=1 Tax=Stephania yunnanensis TaxID=152371 RepID=A0AAP0KFV9_9MAGN
MILPQSAHIEFIDENIVNYDDNMDIIDNEGDKMDIVDSEEDNMEIVDNVDIGDDNKENNNEYDCDDSVDRIEAIDLPEGSKE